MSLREEHLMGKKTILKMHLALKKKVQLSFVSEVLQFIPSSDFQNSLSKVMLQSITFESELIVQFQVFFPSKSENFALFTQDF